MTPERISELRKWVGEHVLEGQCLVDVDTDEVLDLLATAEREAKLREALEGMTELWLNVGGTELNPAYEDAIAALEQKGGEQ